ncbi:MAG: hypothetical protein QXZ12_06895, partial [Thermoplasmata archaeon]
MSTRCQILFEEIGENHSNDKKYCTKAQIYRHSDSYPSGVIPDLMRFYKWWQNEPMPRITPDPSYEAANFIYYMKLESYKKLLEDGNGRWIGWEKLGYGVGIPETIHGDEDYLWMVVWDTDKYPNENLPRIYVADVDSSNDRE